MTTAMPATDRLTSAAKAAGLKRTKTGLWRTGSDRSRWQVCTGPQGNLIVCRRERDRDSRRLLAEHADWAGPVKLLREDGNVIQRAEVFAGNLFEDDQIETLDAEELTESERLCRQILELATGRHGGDEGVAGWEPPPAKLVSDWLAELGREAAVDEQENVRLAVKRRGCDGQIRVTRQTGRLRFTMPLGQWDRLEPEAEAAVLALADEANSRSRLVRVAWVEDEQARRIEAQVDLSGLPLSQPPGHWEIAMWKQMVRSAVAGLELTLRRLGLEMNALANPKNGEFSALVAEWYSV